MRKSGAQAALRVESGGAGAEQPLVAPGGASARRAAPRSPRAARMPKYYCDYCDCYLVSSSIAVRKQHNNGAKHKANVKAYYLQFVQEKTQKTIDETIKNFEAMRKSGMIPGRGMMPGMPGMVRRTVAGRRPPRGRQAIPRQSSVQPSVNGSGSIIPL